MLKFKLGCYTCGPALVSGGRVRRGLGSEHGTRGFAGPRVWAERAGLRGEKLGRGFGPRGEGEGVGLGPVVGFLGRVSVGFGFVFYFPFSFLFLLQTKFEFKYKFESKQHSNKNMHQHECNNKFSNLDKF